MHRLLAEQLRCATDTNGQVDLVKLGELVSAAYEAGDRDRQRAIDARAHTHDEVEQDLLRTQEFLDTIVENIPIAVFAKCAKDSRYILLNRAGEDYYGLPREQMLGRTPEEIFPADVAHMVNEQDRRVVASGMPMFLEEHLIEVGVKGHDRVINSRKMLITDDAGDPQYLVGVIEDVTERVTTQERISHLAHHDALTDLPNRSAFNATLSERLERAQEASTSFAVLSLDLDRFKEVNDVFGHPVGDMLMRAAADRLAAEADGAFVARIGGDEFMILMPDEVCREEVLALGERLVAAIGNELEVDDYLSHVGLSVGIAVYPDDGVDAATLLANADSALYRAKREGRGTVRFFQSEMDQELRDRRLLQHDLRQALDILQRVEHRFSILLDVFGGEQRHLELAPDGGDRRAQLVRDVCRKLADLVERAFQPLDHAIERFDQVVQLVTGATRRNSQAQVRAGDPLGGLGNLRYRRQRPPGDEPAQQAPTEDDDRYKADVDLG